MKIKKKRPGTDHFLTYKEEKTKRLKESEVREINARERERERERMCVLHYIRRKR